MNAKILLAGLAMALASASALAVESKTCQAQAEHMKAAEHDAFMKKCLAQLNDPAHVKEQQQQQKRARCEQNAKNQKLQGSAQANFVSSCMSKNEAAEAAKAAPAPSQTQGAPSARPKKAAAHDSGSKDGKACLKQAKQKGLKGEERKQFLKDCNANQ